MAQDDSMLMFDLRVYYANILGVLLTKLAEERIEKHFSKCFHYLLEAYAHFQHKLSPEEQNEWAANVNEAVKIFNANVGAYGGKSFDSRAMGVVSDALDTLHFWLYKKMEEKNMFGRANRPARI